MRTDTAGAATEAMAEALAGIGSAPASVGFVFAAAEHDLGTALSRACAVVPGADVIGCSTAGELTERGPLSGSIVCLLVAWPEALYRLGGSACTAESAERARALCDGFDKDLALANMRGLSQGTTVLLGDAASPGIEHLTAQVRRLVGAEQQIVGAGAGTFVGAGDKVWPGGMAALHVFSRRGWGVGVGCGLEAASPRMTVTRARGTTVEELDGRAAVEAYRQLAGARSSDLEGGGRISFLLEHQLGVLLFEQVVRVRAPLGIDPGGGLVLSGELPEGSAVCVVRGNAVSLLQAAKQAAEEAFEQLAGTPAAGVLVFSCVYRGMVLGAAREAELDAVRAVFPRVPVVGFSSYGELAQTRAQLSGYHNSSLVVVAIPS